MSGCAHKVFKIEQLLKNLLDNIYISENVILCNQKVKLYKWVFVTNDNCVKTQRISFPCCSSSCYNSCTAAKQHL